MINSIRDKFFFILVCILWYYIGRANETAGMLLVVAFCLIFLIKKMHQELLFSLIFLIVLSDNYNIYFAKTIKPIVLILITFNLLTDREIGFKSSLHKSFIFFFLIAAITLLFSPNFSYSFQKYISYLLLFITIPSYSLYLIKENKHNFFKNLSYLMIMLVFVSLLSKYFNPSYSLSFEGRLRGMFGNPNGYALFCALTFIVFEISKKQVGCSFSVIEEIFIYTLLLLALWWTGSRSSLLMIVIFLFFSKVNKLSPVLSFLILAIIAFSYQYILSTSVNALESFGLTQQLRLEGDQGLETGSGRLVAWNFAWQEIQKNFFLGLGWSYDELLFFDPKVQAKLNMMNHQGGVHNSYLIFWLNQGLIGLMAFIFPLVNVFIKSSKQSIYAFPLLYSVLFSATFEPWLSASLNPYTIILLILLTLLQHNALGDLDENTIEINKEEVLIETPAKVI